MRMRVWAVVLLCLVFARPAPATEWCEHCAALQAPASPSDARRFPPDPQVNYKHLKLQIRMDRPQSKRFQAIQTLTFTIPQRPLSSIELDAVDLTIARVTDLSGGVLSHRHDGQKLLVRFGKELSPGADFGIRIEYDCRDPKRGMIFALPDDAHKDRPLIVHTQGQSEDNRYWFPCHDSPNARFTSETIVTVPEKYTVVGNGKLVSKKGVGDGLVEWHHSMDKPHVAYLVSLVIGELDVVREEWRGRPVEYFVPAGSKVPVQKIFGKTPKMLDVFSQVLGVEYPYAKYSQAVVPLFAAGGMENISATTLHERSLMDERILLDHDLEDLISHELAHQWFGDMITCKSWPHIWLNEGFASYMEWVWREHSEGADSGTYEAWTTLRQVAENDSVEVGSGVVHSFYTRPGELFNRRSGNPYSKGSSVLHMLRKELGDDLFFAAVRELLQRHAWKTVETDDFRKIIEELSGRSFERFFHQWLHRPGVPHIRATYRWDDGAKESRVQLEQTQTISKDSPAFDVNIDIWLVRDGGDISRHVVPMRDGRGSLVVKSDTEPGQICIDPALALLARWEMKIPAAMLARSLKEGPTLGSKLQAAAALRQTDSASAREIMQGILLDEKADRGLRREVATSLGAMQNPAARDILISALETPRRLADHKVRAAAVSALGKYRHPRAAAALIPYARQDATYTVESLAAQGLGNQSRTDEIVEVLVENARRPAGAIWMRGRVLLALAELNDPRGVEPALAMAAYGQNPTVRDPAIRALGKLGRHDSVRDKVRDFLLSTINDSHFRVASAALTALGDLGDEKAIPALETFASGSAPEEQRESARKAIDAIRQKTGESAVVKDLKDRLDKLEKKLEQK